MTSKVPFVPGRELSRMLASEVEPRLRSLLTDVPLSLAFIGAGSDVLGYDTSRSMDHDWGPRVTILVATGQIDRVRAVVDANLDQLLPSSIAGIATRYSRHQDDSLLADPAGAEHRLAVTSLNRLLESHLNIESTEEITTSVWLSMPMQSLLEITSGEVFVDDVGELTLARRRLAFYPDAIWRYQLSALWMRVAQVNPFIGRTAESGDNVGSALITASIVRDLMRIALLQSRAYAPYAKWLGTCCARTETGAVILPALTSAVSATDWRTREQGVNHAGLKLVQQLNKLELIGEVPATTEQFHNRPFTILPAERIARALRDSLSGTDCEHLPPFVGGIDVVTDSTDALKNPTFQMAFRTKVRVN